MRRILGAIIAATAVGVGIILALTGHLASKIIQSSDNGVFTMVLSDIRWVFVVPLFAAFALGIVMFVRPISIR